MPADRCSECDRPHAEEWPAPEGTCGVRAAEVAEQRAARAAVGTSLGSRLDGETREAQAAREAPIKALWIAHDEAARANVAARVDCAAHVVDWRARCLTAERAQAVADTRLRRAREERAEAQGEAARRRGENARLRARCLALAAALRSYGRHRGGCAAGSVWCDGDEKSCACGLGAALKDGCGR